MINDDKLVELIGQKYPDYDVITKDEGIYGSYEKIIYFDDLTNISLLTRPTIFGNEVYMVEMETEGKKNVAKSPQIAYVNGKMLSDYGVSFIEKDEKVKARKLISIRNDTTPEDVLKGIGQFFDAREVILK